MWILGIFYIIGISLKINYEIGFMYFFYGLFFKDLNFKISFVLLFLVSGVVVSIV